MRITAIVEQAADGVWCASTSGVLAYALTREDALQGVRMGAVGLLAYVRDQGCRLSESSAESVNMEI